MKKLFIVLDFVFNLKTLNVQAEIPFMHVRGILEDTKVEFKHISPFVEWLPVMPPV
jgi:hypothetical protein